jgi:hypothetical protein
LQAALASGGFRHEPGERSRVEGGSRSTFTFTLVRNANSKWALLYLPDAILTVFTPGNRAALVEIRELLEDEFRTLYVFHDARPLGAFRNLVGEWEARYQVRTKFLSTSDILDFKQMSPAEQFAYLRRELELDGAGGAAPNRSGQTKLRGAELPSRLAVKLIGVLQDLTDFENDTGRRTFLKLAGLDDLVRMTKLDGSPRQAASAIIAYFTERECRGMRALLDAIAGLKDLPPEHLEIVTSVLKQYEFE